MKEKKYRTKETELYLDASPRDYILKIKDLPKDEQPRERLIKEGPAALTQQELLAVILNAGSKEESVLELSNRIVREYGERSIFSERNAKKLSEDLDVPLVKSCQIVACGELGRRLFEKNTAGFVMIRNASDVYAHLKEMHNLPKEHLRGLYLNSHNRIIHDEVISIGTLTTSVVHAREVFRPAIEYSAAAIVLAHNHPSGTTIPSEHDIQITEQLVKAGKIVGINILDHVIISKNGFSSIKIKY
jgi:DNA repair protein RadC